MTAADRKLLWGAAAVAALMTAGAVAFAPGAARGDAEVPSTYASGPGGALAAYTLLLDLGFNARRWEDSPAELPESGFGALLILCDPTQPAGKDDRQALARFVSTGGRVLFCGATVRSFFAQALITSQPFETEWKEFSAALPGDLTRGAATITLRPEAYWNGRTDDMTRVYGDGKTGAVISWSIGQGEVIWWAGATPLTNAGIRSTGNLRMFLNTIAPPAHAPGQILWDEYFHGQRGSLWSYISATAIVWTLPQIGLIVVAVLFTFSRRSGPVMMPAVRSRLSPLEFVDTIGGLYQRAGASPVAVQASYSRLRLELSRRLGMPAASTDAGFARAAAERLGLPEDKLLDALRSASQFSASKKLKEGPALKLVQELERYTVQINAPPSWNNSPR